MSLYRRMEGRIMSISVVSSSSVLLLSGMRGGGWLVGICIVVLFCDGAVGLEVGRVGWLCVCVGGRAGLAG